MKPLISAIVLSALLTTGGVADACHKGAHKSAMRGQITGVSGASFTMTTGRRSGGKSMLVYLTRGTSLAGITAFNSSIIGEIATVEGATTGNTINATSVTFTAPRHRASTT